MLEATRYLPQVFASLYGDGSVALSYLRLLLSIGGGVGATVQKALMQEDISTWFPPLVGHSLEMAIVAINLYKDVGKRPSEEGAGAGDEEAGAGVGLGLEGGGSETTPLTGGDAVKAAAVNRAMEKGEKEERGVGVRRGAERRRVGLVGRDPPTRGSSNRAGTSATRCAPIRSSSTRCSSTCESAGERDAGERRAESVINETGRDESARGFVPW